MSWPAPTGDPVGPERGGSPLPHDLPPAGQRPVQPAPVRQPSPTPDRPPQPTPAGRPVEVLTPARDAGTSTAPMPDVPAQGGIATLAPAKLSPTRSVPMNTRTGRPARPWTIWLSASLFFAAAGVVTYALLAAMWQMASPWVEAGDGEWIKDDKFNAATWLTAQFPTDPASWQRVMFAIVCCAIAVLVAAAVTTVGYYAFAGFGWTRFGGLVAVGVSALSLLLSPIAAISIGLAVLGGAPLWLPASRAFFTSWELHRHPRAAYSEPVENVFYGPLPRYR